jgi:acyl-coenzyme A thioesterase PaaI-like protein
MGILPVYKNSFFTSPDRKDGLGLNMIYEKGTVYTDMRVDNRFEGYEDVVQGGIIFGILDVIMWYVIFMETKKICMTRKTEMDFFKPVMCNTQYKAKGELLRIEDRDIYASAWVEDSSGECYAKVTALFREGKDISIPAFIDRLDFTNTPPEIKEHFLSLLEKVVSSKE